MIRPRLFYLFFYVTISIIIYGSVLREIKTSVKHLANKNALNITISR